MYTGAIIIYFALLAMLIWLPLILTVKIMIARTILYHSPTSFDIFDQHIGFFFNLNGTWFYLEVDHVVKLVEYSYEVGENLSFKVLLVQDTGELLEIPRILAKLLELYGFELELLDESMLSRTEFSRKFYLSGRWL